jgi:ubiquinone/menaquinone biosynthesis C-methylase UbiE
MDRLAEGVELLDGPLDDPATLAGNLRDLRRINRLLGGIRLSRHAIERLAPGWTELDLLDVGTGAADIPTALLADARRRGRRLRVTAVDSRPEVLDAARRARPGLERVLGLSLATADGLRLDWPDGAFEIAHCSLVLHHLEPPDAIALAREMARVARRGIVVNDLARGRLHWLGAKALTTVLTRNAFTRHDGPMSVRRAYTRAEVRALLAAADLRPVADIGGLAGHRFAIAATGR